MPSPPASAAPLAARHPVDPVGRQARRQRGAEDPAPVALEAVWARHADEVLAAQRLRWRVFADELGARLDHCPVIGPGVDADRFDPFCEHLLVRTQACADLPSKVVGTYRVLTPAAARVLGSLYTDGEFDIGPLEALRPRLLELGRSCVDPAFRQGAVIMMLWGSLASFMRDNRLDSAIGCASLPMHDGGHGAASLWHRLAPLHLVEKRWQVRPRLPLPLAELRHDLEVAPPPLVKGYLRCGARLLGQPAWDADFGVADLPMLLMLADLPLAYRKRFLAD